MNSTTLDASPSLVRTAHIVYALHALGLAIGAFGAASVLGSFLFGWPSIIAVIINYVKRSEARGTWLESHFDWQIRTFWWGLLWSVLGVATIWVLGLGFVVLAANAKKREELRAMISAAGLPARPRLLDELPRVPEIVEDRDTFAANAERDPAEQ